jgi:hypothetical protein
VIVGVVLALLASPRHRALWLGGTVPAARVQAREFVRRMAGRPPVAVIATKREVVAADADGLKVPMSDDPPPRLPAEGVPTGWELREFSGRAEVSLVRGEQGLAVRLRSDRTSFALHRDLVVGLDDFPILGWSWKVTRLPTGSDVRLRERDDQAAQVYVVFPRWPSARSESHVIGYVWDTTAPVGTTLSSTKAPNVKIIVVESGPARLGTWQRHRRNVAADYEALFRQPAPRVGAIALMIDSNDTGSAAESAIGEIMFVRASAAERGKTPASMLR